MSWLDFLINCLLALAVLALVVLLAHFGWWMS